MILTPTYSCKIFQELGNEVAAWQWLVYLTDYQTGIFVNRWHLRRVLTDDSCTLIWRSTPKSPKARKVHACLSVLVYSQYTHVYARTCRRELAKISKSSNAKQLQGWPPHTNIMTGDKFTRLDSLGGERRTRPRFGFLAACPLSFACVRCCAHN